MLAPRAAAEPAQRPTPATPNRPAAVQPTAATVDVVKPKRACLPLAAADARNRSPEALAQRDLHRREAAQVRQQLRAARVAAQQARVAWPRATKTLASSDVLGFGLDARHSRS
jgi:hypothetical protein